MSRLLIKNLPTYVTPARLKEYFEQKKGPGGTLTDVKVAHKRDGTSRRFGFVGYKTEQEAQASKDWFDRTYLDSSRISVTVVEGVKGAPAPRPNKRPRLGPSPNDAGIVEAPPSQKNKKDKKTLKDTGGDSQLDEFMKVMKPRTNKGPSWVNEESSTHDVVPSKEHISSVDEAGSEGDVLDTAISDIDWMKKHMSKSVDKMDKVFEQSDDEVDEVNNTVKDTSDAESPPKDLTKETIMQTSRLFLRNLAFACTESELLELFKPFGEISQVHMPLDSTTKLSKGLAYVSFAKPENALAAYEALDGKSFQGRLLHILAAVHRQGKLPVEESEGKKRTLKEERNTKRRAMAGKEFNWSMLYMNSDAVASSVADRFNIDKNDILNPESGGNPAVKLALAETHIIQETKSYLESQGVLLSSFSSRARSDTTILVKNIPYGTTMEQIRELFEPHGELNRVLVPPAGTMAVVEFENPDEAARAFRAVAYRRLGNSVIYLEKGPLELFSEDAGAPPSQLESSTAALPVVKIAEQATEGTHADQGEEMPSVVGGTTLYVKNLSFATTQQRFAQVFQHLPSFAFARIQTKSDSKRPNGPRLSMGYGFVGFKDVEGAKKGLKSMQGFVLDGHALHVKFAGRGAEEEEKGKDGKVSSKSKTAKMIVKNVPFEATKKDIRDLFSSYGHLKSVRLPKKFDSRTRGFAFIEFVSRHEAENAYAALRHTHLLGRHLVLEWAEEAEQDLEALRKKAGVGFGDGKDMPGRKRKLDLDVGSGAENEEES
ncbi:hypothetical protein AX17_005499 [Amanita inopinata Kibby_2008]|nr:hypothetical protein AX17_005499 [Amanita inopinata Kibby_2008]